MLIVVQAEGLSIASSLGPGSDGGAARVPPGAGFQTPPRVNATIPGVSRCGALAAGAALS